MPNAVLDPRFVEAAKMLQEAGIQFVIVGGVALNLHGGRNVTKDFDFSYARDEDNCERVAEAMNQLKPRPLGWPVHNPFQVTVPQLKRVRFLNLKTSLGDIDLLPLPDGVDSFDGLWERSVVMDMGDFTVRVASIDDLIAMKRAANRPKDQLHLYELQALQRVIAEEQEDAGTIGA
ncbi:nucleotidyl transferase AbiEii/AbiGii toxin family protein [Armatimonas sp.]|uniref:nucleotidyl transferase AbiEii/AbiGii toxin family protein n=1 Tax=Armatimonas sp. TaxID=1872638 RepID=UPI0037533C24